MKARRYMTLILLCGLPWTAHTQTEGDQRRARLENDISKLYSGDANVRTEAAKRLAASGSAAIPLLVPVVCDKSKLNFDVAWQAAAKALADLKAEAGARCLVQMLAYDLSPPIYKPDKTLVDSDPAFAALVEIGEPVVSTVRQYLPVLHPDQAYLALRVLRVINTPPAKQAAEAYIQLLENQIRLSKGVIEEFRYGPGLTR